MSAEWGTKADRPAAVVDTSVAVKWFLSDGESHVRDALALLDRHRIGEQLLVAPDLLVLEFLGVLARRGVRSPRLEGAARDLVLMDLEFVPVAAIAVPVAALVCEYGISAYDAAFAAVANRLSAPLITADRRLAESGACDAVLLGA